MFACLALKEYADTCRRPVDHLQKQLTYAMAYETTGYPLGTWVSGEFNMPDLQHSHIRNMIYCKHLQPQYHFITTWADGRQTEPVVGENKLSRCTQIDNKGQHCSLNILPHPNLPRPCLKLLTAVYIPSSTHRIGELSTVLLLQMITTSALNIKSCTGELINTTQGITIAKPVNCTYL